MRSLNEINAEIAQVERKLKNVQGSPTEVYARIVGYYRSVRNWNKGKREEFNHRKMFNPHIHQPTYTENSTKQIHFNEISVPAYIEVYTRSTCPNCPPINDYCGNLTLPVEQIDVDSPQGFAKARKLNIRTAPTVVLYNQDGNELTRVYSVKELEALKISA